MAQDKHCPLWRQLWGILILIAILGARSNTFGQARVLLNNYYSDCPIIDVDHLATDASIHIEVLCEPDGAGSRVAVQIETNGETSMSLKEPGFFDGGVGIIPGLPTGTGLITLAFEIRIWTGELNYDFASRRYLAAQWSQQIDLSANATNNVVPSSLIIPNYAIWLMCADCSIEQEIFTAIRGKGKVEVHPLWPFPEGTSRYDHLWPPWGPVSLHAVADRGYRLANWKGTIHNPDEVPSGPSDFIELYATNEWLDFEFKWGAANILATFEPGWRLRANVPYGGSVSNSPAGLDYAPGTEVTLTATAKPYFEFSEWTGDIVGTNPVTTVVLNTNINATANFRPTTTPQLVLQSSDIGDGVSSNGFGFTLLGNQGTNYTVESSRDLSHWSTFTNLTSTKPALQLRDTLPTDGVRRFYRARTN